MKETFEQSAVRGLSRRPRGISPKYLYDERGSSLFERITRLEEYYPTRIEIGILERMGASALSSLGPEGVLIELGSGSSLKTRPLLRHAPPGLTYVPVDICGARLRAEAERLALEFPGLRVVPAEADFTHPFELPAEVAGPARRRMVFFPGSTIGNFDPEDAAGILARSRELAGPGGTVLVGADLLKPAPALEAAYNDSEGVTAEFNLNLLRRMNRELDADFDLSAFRHRAFLNASLGRIEMHLVSVREQTVRVAGREFEFGAGESIHTESSWKHTPESFGRLARAADLSVRRMWTDDRAWYALFLLESQAPLGG